MATPAYEGEGELVAESAPLAADTILAKRYRIVGLLGQGEMGEVYRADDLKLGQPVALKFLPDHLLSDGAALARGVERSA